jgi:hypothetical protein
VYIILCIAVYCEREREREQREIERKGRGERERERAGSSEREREREGERERERKVREFSAWRRKLGARSTQGRRKTCLVLGGKIEMDRCEAPCPFPFRV